MWLNSSEKRPHNSLEFKGLSELVCHNIEMWKFPAWILPSAGASGNSSFPWAPVPRMDFLRSQGKGKKVLKTWRFSTDLSQQYKAANVFHGNDIIQAYSELPCQRTSGSITLQSFFPAHFPPNPRETQDTSRQKSWPTLPCPTLLGNHRPPPPKPAGLRWHYKSDPQLQLLQHSQFRRSTSHGHLSRLQHLYNALEKFSEPIRLQRPDTSRGMKHFKNLFKRFN